MEFKILDLYTDYLISSFGQTTATGMARLLDNKMSHDKITRFLSSREFTSKDLWKFSKKIVREIESSDGVIAIDDSIEEKPYTDENELICWHFDHSKGRSVKGIGFVTALYASKDIKIPVAYDLVTKTEKKLNDKGKVVRRSSITKNERYRNLLSDCVNNKISFKYVLNDVWYSSSENINFINDLKKYFIMPLKKNRKVALSGTDKKNGRYVKIEKLCFEGNAVRKVYLEGVIPPVNLIKQVFKNEDGSSGTIYLITSDFDLTYDQITTIYKKRWKVEEFHKSIKNNASLAKSPTKTVQTQANHFFASMCAFIKLEGLSVRYKMNNFALKSSLYISAIKTAYKQLRKFMPKDFEFGFECA